MQRLEVSVAVRPIYRSLGVKRLDIHIPSTAIASYKINVVCFLLFLGEPQFCSVNRVTVLLHYVLNKECV